MNDHSYEGTASMQSSTLEDDSSTTNQQQSAILIANPTSGSYLPNAAQIQETVAILRKQGWDAQLRLTQQAGDTTKFAREAVEQGIDVVVAIGGDGTVNEVIQALAGSQTALAVLPAGTVNVWARETGIPLDLIAAREILLHGQKKRIDLGQINGRYFLLMTTLGLDAEITHAVEKKFVKRLGILGYLLIGARLGMQYAAFRFILELNGHSTKNNALQIIIGNTQLYAGAIKYTWQAKCDDGTLDICIIYKQNIFGRVAMLWDFLLRRKQRRQWIRYETGSTIKIHTRKAVAVQMDGEPFGYTQADGSPTVISVVPATLNVIVPSVLVGDLFSQS
jgi:diacylglycerol kinase (ATP)